MLGRTRGNRCKSFGEITDAGNPGRQGYACESLCDVNLTDGLRCLRSRLFKQATRARRILRGEGDARRDERQRPRSPSVPGSPPGPLSPVPAPASWLTNRSSSRAAMMKRIESFSYDSKSVRLR